MDAGTTLTGRPPQARGKDVMPKILIVDDSFINRELISATLKLAHPEYLFLHAEDGRGALESVYRDRPDLVLLDIMMPEMDGFEVCSRLKNDPSSRDIPVLMITALDQLEHKIQGFRVGAADYIVKPFNGEEITARVDAHLRIKGYQDELKRLNLQLQQTQEALVAGARLSAVGSLAAGVAHEFNNILGIMKGYLQLAAEDQQTESTSRLFSVLNDLVERGIQIVKALLNFSRQQPNEEMKPGDLNQIVRETISLVEKSLRASKVDFEVVYNSALPPVFCFSSQISQLLLHLINNALDAMEKSTLRRLSVKIVLLSDGTRVQLEVADTGRGIPSTVREKIFEPFVTTKGVLGGGDVSTPGTGLGLSICYGIVQRHAGRIWFDSRESLGTRFFVELPVSPPLRAAAEST